jgi:hypothetical protein
MKKTSLYLSEDDEALLERLAARKGMSRARVLREALAAYDAQEPDRDFAMFGTFDGDGTSVADIPEEELLRGFGEQ